MEEFLLAGGPAANEYSAQYIYDAVTTQLVAAALDKWFQDARNDLLSRGYQDIGVRSRFAVATDWYQASPASADVTVFLAFERKKALRAYAVYFGLSCNSARLLLLSAAPKLRRKFPNCDFDDYIPCWTMFDAGRALGWPVLTIPDPSGQIQESIQWTQFVRDILVTTVESASSCLDVLRVLRRNDKPFEWFANHPVTRAASVVATARMQSMAVNELKEDLMQYAGKLPGTYHNPKDWKSVVEVLLECIWPQIDHA